MMQSGDRNPFQPESAGFPPHFAGREVEQALFLRFFRTLRRGVPVPSEILVYGPSGNGKTTLLIWAEEEARELGLDFCRVESDEVRTPAELVTRLDLETWLPEFAPEGVSPDEAGGQRSGLPRLAEALEARAKDTPLVVLVDEAHALEPEIGRWLLNAAQVAGSRAPFLLILAGAPDLRARLSGMGASFWHRAKKLAVGRLADAAVAEAIRRPLATEGTEIEEDALARIVRESHGYPYFVQLWGKAVWDTVQESPESERRVTLSVVESAAADFQVEKSRHLADTVATLESAGVFPAAREVAAAFRGRKRLGNEDFREAVGRALGDDAASAIGNSADALEHLGFVWGTKGVPAWEPGIPSLMDYILKHTAAPAEGA